jgi:ribonuclease III
MPSTTSSPDSEVSDVDPRDVLCELLAYRFASPGLLDLALRHRSWCAENGAAASNERLEFLGDAVLGLVVTDHLYRAAPDMSEGVLARHRSELVSAAALAGVARSVELGAAIALGKGEEATGGREKTSILADGMEAVIGAVYLDGGIGAATTLVLHLLEERIDEVLHGGLASDHKSRLQEFAAQRFGQLPRYVLRGEGPEHEKHFWARVELGGRSWGEGEGRTKKQAEQAAALSAYDRLREEPSPPVGQQGEPHPLRMASEDVAGAPAPVGTTQGDDHA